MIYLLIKSYFSILVSVALVAMALFGFGVYCIWKSLSHTAKKEKPSINEREILNIKNITDVKTTAHFSPQDVAAISGEDVITTQLDLARAYIELDKRIMAKEILKIIIENGHSLQQAEAQRLLNTL